MLHALFYGDKGHLYDCACVRWVLAYWVRIRGYSMCTRVRAQTLQHARQGRTLDHSPIECLKPAMLVSSVQAVVACYATVPRVCTLVLFIFICNTRRKFLHLNRRSTHDTITVSLTTMVSLQWLLWSLFALCPSSLLLSSLSNYLISSQHLTITLRLELLSIFALLLCLLLYFQNLS